MQNINVSWSHGSHETPATQLHSELGVGSNVATHRCNASNNKLHRTQWAWSESSGACPKARGGHRMGENLGARALATFEWRGPSWRISFGFLEESSKRQIARPVGPSRQSCFWRRRPKMSNSSPRYRAKGWFQGNQYAILSSTVLLPSPSVTANRITTLSCAYTMHNGSKITKMADISKTGSRNMVETCAIDFFTKDSFCPP